MYRWGARGRKGEEVCTDYTFIFMSLSVQSNEALSALQVWHVCPPADQCGGQCLPDYIGSIGQ